MSYDRTPMTAPNVAHTWPQAIPADVKPDIGLPTFTEIFAIGGYGKTSLAATWPTPFFLDYDQSGAASVGVLRLPMPRTTAAIKALSDIVDACERGKYDPATRLLTVKLPNGQTVAFSTLVVDHVDAIQQAVKPYLLGNRLKMEKQDWGALLELVRPPFDRMINLPIHKVVVGHAVIRNPDGDDLGEVGTTMQGALRTYLPTLADVVLIGMSDAANQISWYCQPTRYRRGTKEYIIAGKDRHGFLRDAKYTAGPMAGKPMVNEGSITNKRNPITFRPTNQIAQAICSRGTAALPEDATLTERAPDPTFNGVAATSEE